jgi:hypothetical protein
MPPSIENSIGELDYFWDVKMGRRRTTEETTTVRLPAGTIAAVERALKPNEKQAEFLRIAIARELQRRRQSPEALLRAVEHDGVIRRARQKALGK